jgi:hypothetical protein
LADHPFAESVPDAKDWRAGLTEQLQSADRDDAAVRVACDLARSAHDVPHNQDPLAPRSECPFGKIEEDGPVTVVDQAIRSISALDDVLAEHARELDGSGGQWWKWRGLQ